jgi:hypothetical protein
MKTENADDDDKIISFLDMPIASCSHQTMVGNEKEGNCETCAKFQKVIAKNKKKGK